MVCLVIVNTGSGERLVAMQVGAFLCILLARGIFFLRDLHLVRSEASRSVSLKSWQRTSS